MVEFEAWSWLICNNFTGQNFLFKSFIFNLGLLNKSFKSIFSEKVTGRYNNKENHNRDLINKLYEINKKGNLEVKKKTENIINLLNMKFEQFFNYLKIYLDDNTSEKSEKSIDKKEKDLNNIFILQLIKQFIIKLNKYLIKDNEDEDYKKKLKEKLKNLPLVINNMKERNKK